MKMCVKIVMLAVLVSGAVSLDRSLIVRAPAGEIEGIVTSVEHDGQIYNVTSFLGIPFAEPPIKGLRFSKPIKKKPFATRFKATTRGHACIQLEYSPDAITSEDCLNLNVIVPRSAVGAGRTEARAVLVYIHGGWWQYGLQDEYIAPAFVAKNDVILVTLNYRLNAYGFLAHEAYGLKGNYGLWDQQMAIKWVHDNIQSFGGDRTRVTLIGNSAGAVSILLQALYPENQGLFKGIIALSGSLVAPWAYNREYKKTFVDFVKRCGCDTQTDVVSCLRNLDTSDVDVEMIFQCAKLHLPVFDGEFITFSPEDFDVTSKTSSEIVDRLSSFDLITGLLSCDGSWAFREWESEMLKRDSDFSKGITESDFRVLIKHVEKLLGLDFNDLDKSSIIYEYIDWKNPSNTSAIRDNFLSMDKDLEFTNGAVTVALAHARGNGRGQTFMFEFDHKPSFAETPSYIRGAVHEDELPYVFGFPNDLMKKRGIAHADPVVNLTRPEVWLSDQIQQLFAVFAKARNSEEFEELRSFPWPTFDATDRRYLILRANEGITTGSHYRGSAVHFWNVLMPQIEAASTCTTSRASRAQTVLALLSLHCATAWLVLYILFGLGISTAR